MIAVDDPILYIYILYVNYVNTMIGLTIIQL